ncbi:biorientation of chromosomes in cell division protein 1-like 1 [Dreissena polymorpha]|uniref:Uncharacterized protein n=1 Tax=Dreissena polymorpha TaxID=45954 RepID=A0A9D4MZ61_DREPO|nr:biorientation of chromosomes in cell division protein 1-like 1 [Dreissena polymorpha]XP_052226118.1 biorientation of chromosomes in cell division protein 1-like 1 [Dreissena polymorpha]XP_052226127.1 biorientation of chromosomes in cell division protein 1-like 1 [Dreissena polymorpha]KAH3886025.1 hypothetical protein DPMN_010026 [Dreissena polymorpha]
MSDPGLPPKPRSLNLLESVIHEEEAREQIHRAANIVLPTVHSVEPGSPEFYDKEKQQIRREKSSGSAFTELTMKDTPPSSKVRRADPNAGFKGKKIKKSKVSRVDSAENNAKDKNKKPNRPLSADYNKFRRMEKIDNGRPSTAKERARSAKNRPLSPEDQRPRSPRSYSSDTYSSDDEYLKKKKYRSDSDSSLNRTENGDSDDFFDKPVDREVVKDSHRDRSSSSSTSRSSNSNSNNSDYNKEQRKQTNGKGASKHDNTKQNGRSDSESSDEKVPVDYQSSLMSLSSSEVGSKQSSNKPPRPSSSKRPLKKSKPLLSRKKRQNLKIFQIDPDLYLEGKLHQKYSELEELVNCSFVDQKSHVTRHHLYQMELLRDQYTAASHGLPSAATIIPRSLPEEIRTRSMPRPSSAKRPPSRRYAGSDQDSIVYDNAYGTLRSVMSAEHLRTTNRIRTDILAERPSSATHASKKTKTVKKAKHKPKKDDTSSEKSNSDRHSYPSSNPSSNPSSTPRVTQPHIDHHIKYTDNELLKKWLKEKDKIYRRQVREERRKKREEREKLIDEANEKLESRIKSQKEVKKWMKEKNKELAQKQREAAHQHRVEVEKEEQRKLNLPGDTIHIRPQSTPLRRPEDIHIDKHQLKGDKTPDFVKEQIHMKREIEEENKQAKLASEGGPHPPQTKFIYKRPVAGKIKLKMQVQGKGAAPAKSEKDPEKKAEDTEDKEKQMRMSYDDWVKKKRESDAAIKRQKSAEKQRELAKSDPELERIIPALGRQRIADKLNSRKRIDTGIRKFDEQANKSFGGADFSGEEIQRPRSAYRLERDRNDDGHPALTVSQKQLQRPSTAPSSRSKPPPTPKKSAKSPRKAIIPTRVDKVMSNEDVSNPYHIPFPPEKGVPLHVAERQRKIFADIVTNNLNEIEQRALLNAELIKEGVSDEDIALYRKQMEEELAKFDRNSHQRTHQIQDHNAINEENIKDAAEIPEHIVITDVMYSPRKRSISSSSSSSEDDVTTLVGFESDKENIDKSENNKPDEQKLVCSNVSGEKKDKIDEKYDIPMEPQEDVKAHSHYKTYDNLNELQIESPRNDERDNNSELGEDIERLKERVSHLNIEDLIGLHVQHSHGSTGRSDSPVEKEVTIVAETDPNVVGILKESKREENLKPELHESAEFEISGANKPDGFDGNDDGLNNSRKRVSFNEHTEVFQSFESTSTDTVTPDEADFDPNAESLDAQNYADDFEDELREVRRQPDEEKIFITNPDDETSV